MDEAGDYTIDKTTIDSLSSETRILILSSLRERKKTNAELAKELSLTPPTIHHHLELLKNANLITPEGNDHKWVYYDLTPFGRSLLVPGNRMRVSLLLSSFLTFVMAVAIAFTYFTMPSLDVKPWVPVTGDPFLALFIIASLAFFGQIAVYLYAIHSGR